MRAVRPRTVILAAAALLTALSLTACDRGIQPATDLPEPSGTATETTETSVFYATGRTLLQEKKVVDAADPYVSTLEELLLASPENNADVAIVQPFAQVKSITVEDGLATIDWTSSILDFEAEPGEKRIALASILATMGQFPEVDRVQFTVEGKSEGEIDGKDIVDFWGDVSLLNQPWDVIRVQGRPSGESTATTAPPTAP